MKRLRCIGCPLEFSHWLIVLLLVLLAACGSRSQHEPQFLDESLTRIASTDGEEIYRLACAVCHGDQGEGYLAERATQLAHPYWINKVDETFVRVAIARGREGTKMSAFGESFGGQLTEEQVDNLVDAVFDLFASDTALPEVTLPQSLVGDASTGHELFTLHCAQCHGERGTGGSAMQLNTPSFLDTASPEFLWKSIALGRPEVGIEGYDYDLMPAFQEKLSDSEISDLVAAIRSFR